MAKRKKKKAKRRPATSRSQPKKADRNPPGRPTKYRPEYCKDLIEHRAKGHSFESFGAALAEKYGEDARVHRDTLYEWSVVHQEFSDVKKAAKDACLFYYQKLAQAGMSGQLRRVVKEVEHRDPETGHVTRVEREYGPASFGQAAWIFSMKNMHDWRDKQEITGKDGESLSIAGLVAAVAVAGKK